MLNSNFQFSTFNFPLNNRSPFHKVLHQERSPSLLLHVPVNDGSFHLCWIVCFVKLCFVIDQCPFHKLEISVLLVIGNHGMPVQHVVQQCFQSFCHPLCGTLRVTFLHHDPSFPSCFHCFTLWHLPFLFFHTIKFKMMNNYFFQVDAVYKESAAS